MGAGSWWRLMAEHCSHLGFGFGCLLNQRSLRGVKCRKRVSSYDVDPTSKSRRRGSGGARACAIERVRARCNAAD